MKQEEVLKEIQAIKKIINVSSTELENFLQYIDQIVFNKKVFAFFCGPPAVTSSPQFTRAFSALKSYERAEYYLSCLKIINEINKKKQPKEQGYSGQQRYQVLFRDYKISQQWRLTFIILNYDKATLFLGFTGQLLNLKNYLFRNSKCKERTAFALQANRPDINPQTLRLSSNFESALQEIRYKIKKIMLIALRQSIFKMMNISRQIKQQFAKKGSMNRESISQSFQQLTVYQVGQNKKSMKDGSNQKTSKIDFNIEEFQRIEADLINQVMIKQLDNFRDYEKVKPGVFFSHSKPLVKKIFTFQQKQVTVEWVSNELFDYQNFKKWKASLFMITLLADISNENTKIFHEVDMYKDSSQCDFVYLRHKFIRGDIIYFIDKSISTIEQNNCQSTNNRGTIQYCLWRIKKTKLKTIQVTVECQMNHIACLDIYEIISQQIGQFDSIVKSKKMQKMQKKQRQATIKSDFDFSGSINVISQVSNVEFSQFTNGQGQRSFSVPQSSFYSISSKEGPNDKKKDKTEDEVWQWETVKSYSPSATYSYQIMPIQSPKQFQQFKGEKFFNPEESIVNQKGEFIFVNAKKIQAQSSVLKNILKRLSANLFSGKSLLNVSLPIQIFGTDTNLQRLSRAMAYGPHFLQNKINASPLEKMKGVLSFSLGTILLYLEMTKPFNPVLGETYQGFIDGCPIYGEQISHHPPISSILFIGRGYFVSANLQAKVQFGLNSISGINDGEYKIAFHETDPTKNVITFTSPPGSLAGIIYGERKLTLIKKTYFFDASNLILCEISWGKSKDQNKDSKFNDYLNGKIVRLKKLELNFEKIKDKDIEEVLGNVSGRWTEQISFNNQVIFDVNSLKPFKVTNESVPLRSDSCYREDMKLLGQQDVVTAQNMKEDIEQLQRKDRKLRQQYSK